MLSWMPHGHCFQWEPAVYWPWIISEVMIFCCYSLAFGLIAHVVLTRIGVNVFTNTLIFLLASFVFVCGVDHLLGAIQLHRPIYHLVSFWKVVVNFVSVAFAVVGIKQLVYDPWRARRA